MNDIEKIETESSCPMTRELPSRQLPQAGAMSRVLVEDASDVPRGRQVDT